MYFKILNMIMININFNFEYDMVKNILLIEFIIFLDIVDVNKIIG